jgi:hypothetical protein
MPPRLIALLACREISIDQNNTITLAGIVSTITMPSFPRALEGYLFIRLSGLDGDHRVRLEIRDVGRGVTVGTSEWDVTEADSGEVQDFTVTIDIDVTEPVTIEARILVDGAAVGWSNVEIHGPPEPE